MEAGGCYKISLDFLRGGGILKFEPESERKVFFSEDPEDAEKDVLTYKISPEISPPPKLQFSVYEPSATTPWEDHPPTLGSGQEVLYVRMAPPELGPGQKA